jgi:hypothetical protein
MTELPGVARNEFALVGFFAEVEVGVDGVLKQVNDAIAGHDEHWTKARAEFQALWSHLDYGRGHEEACAESDEVAQVALDASGADEHQAAGYVGQRGDCAQKQGELHHRD